MNRRFERAIVKLSVIKEDPTNPNVMNDREKEALANSIEKFGYVQDIVVDKNTMIIADGFHRFRQLLVNSHNEAEVILYDFENDIERRLFRQVANKVRGTHDETLDALEFKRILESVDMQEFTELTGQSEQEILRLLNKFSEEEKKYLNLEQNTDIQKSEDGETITLTLIYTLEEMSIIKAVLGDNIALGLLNICKGTDRYNIEKTNETQETSTN